MTSPAQFLENFIILIIVQTVVHKRRKGCLLAAHEQRGKVKNFDTFFKF